MLLIRTRPSKRAKPAPIGGGGSDPSITSPTPGGTLASSSQTFAWQSNGTPVTEYWLYVGSSVGGTQYRDSGSLDETTESLLVSGLPTDGSTIYVRLFWRTGAGGSTWFEEDFTFTAHQSEPQVPGTWTDVADHNGVEAFSWRGAVPYDSTRDRFWSLNWPGFLWTVNAATGAYTTIGRVFPSPEAGMHNRAEVYDPLNDRYWLGGGTSQGTPSPPASHADQHWINPDTAVGTHVPDSANPTYEAFAMFDPYGQTNYWNSPTDNPAAPRLIALGGWQASGPGGSPYPVHVKALSPVGSWVDHGIYWTSGPPTPVDDSEKFHAYRTVYDSARDEIVVVDPLRDCIWTIPRRMLTVMFGQWKQRPYSGGETLPRRIHCSYDEDRDIIVAWCGEDAVTPNGGVSAPRETWLLNMRTLTWALGAHAGPDTVPLYSAYVSTFMTYDPVRKRHMLFSARQNDDNRMAVWHYAAPAREAGTFTKIALPAFSGLEWGVNNFGWPWCTNLTGTKHQLGTYNTYDDCIYITGGDGDPFGRSAVDGMWKINPSTGAITCVTIPPALPGGAALQPSGLNDPHGWYWDEIREVYVHIPSYFLGYQGSSNVADLCRGQYEYNPATDTWSRDLRIWAYMGVSGTPPNEAYNGAGTGCLFGALYDPVTRHAILLSDNNSEESVFRIYRWDLANGVSVGTNGPDAQGRRWEGWTPAATNRITNGGSRVCVTRHGRSVRVARYGYFLGVSIYDSEADLFDMNFLRLNLDTMAVDVLTPPIRQRKKNAIGDGHFGLVKCGSRHIVWPEVNTEGVIHGIHVYDIVTDRWWREKLPVAPTNPAGFHPTLGGRFCGNAFGEAGPTKMWFCGSQTDSVQSFWMYEPPGAVA